MQQDEPRSRHASARRWRSAVVEQLLALARDPFFFLTGAILCLKSLAAVMLINNPNSSALDTASLDAYEYSPAIFVAFIAIPLSIGLWLRGRARLAYYLALDGAFSLLLVADLWYFRSYKTFLSVRLWQETANLKGLWDSILSMSRPVDLVFLADLAVLIPLVVLRRALYREAPRAVAFAALVPIGALACLAIEHRTLDSGNAASEQRLVEPCWEARQTISYQSPLGFHLLDLYDVFLENRSVALSPAQIETIRAWFAAKREAVPGGRYGGLLKGRNLIVVQVESLENCVVGRTVNGQEITPTINALLPSSLRFTNVYEQVHEGSSSDADLMTNTSVYPIRKGATFFRFPANAYNSLPRILRGAGYRATLAMHPDPAVYWNWKNALTAIGFEKCLDESAFVEHETLGLGMSDEDFLTQAAERIARLPEPFYAFMVTLTSHAPFDLPEKYRELTLEEPLESSCLGDAFQAFHYADRSLGAFLARLRRCGVLERSAVVIYGDHASVHRFYNDRVQAIEGLEDWMRDPRWLVPLVVYAPGITGERIDVTGGQVDIMPTVLGLLGVDESVTAETAMGRNLLRTARDFAVGQDGTVVGRDRDAPFSKSAVKGLAIADLAIRGDYFRVIGYGRR